MIFPPASPIRLASASADATVKSIFCACFSVVRQVLLSFRQTQPTACSVRQMVMTYLVAIEAQTGVEVWHRTVNTVYLANKRL